MERSRRAISRLLDSQADVIGRVENLVARPHASSTMYGAAYYRRGGTQKARSFERILGARLAVADPPHENAARDRHGRRGERTGRARGSCLYGPALVS